MAVFAALGRSLWHHWSLNGSSDGEAIGTSQDDGTSLASRERRARIGTGPDAQMTMAQCVGPLHTGTDSLAPGGDSWTFTTASGSSTYSRVT